MDAVPHTLRGSDKHGIPRRPHRQGRKAIEGVAWCSPLLGGIANFSYGLSTSRVVGGMTTWPGYHRCR